MRRLFSISMVCLMVLSVILTVIPANLSGAPATGRTGSREVSDLVAVNGGLTNQGQWTTLRFIDLNKDQYLDIVGATWGWPGMGALAYTSNNGASWTAASTGLPNSGTYGLGDIGDVNGDGNMDLVLPYEHSQSGGAENGIEVWKSSFTGGVVSWSHGTDPVDTGGWSGVGLGDVDTDGKMDIAATRQWPGAGITFWQGDGGTTWTNKSVGLPTTGNYNGIRLADMNKDGRLDIVAAWGQGWKLFTSKADLSWTDNSTGLSKAYNIWTPRVIDFNKDGNLDIAGSTDGHGFKVMTGNGGAGGTFQWTDVSAGLPAGNDYEGIAVGNVDRDGNPDLIGGSDWTSFGVDMYLGNGGVGGSMSWTQAGTSDLPSAGDYLSIDIADFNGDGTGDFLLGEGYSSSGLSVFKTIAPPSKRPLANAGDDQTVYVGDLVKLNGTASSDDTGIKAYKWNISSQPVGSAASLSSDSNVTPTFKPLVAGIYVLSLNIKDKDDQWGLVEATVRVTAKLFPNAKPLANAGPDQEVTVLTPVKLNGSASWDDASVTAYNWNITSKPADSIITLSDETVVCPTFTPEIVGTYKFTLTVKDINNTWAKNDEVLVKAKPSGTGPPTANAGADETIELGNTTQLNGSASADDQQIKLYDWSVDSEPSGSNLVVLDAAVQNITPLSIGPYIFSLKVRDNDNLWSLQADTMSLTVIPKNLAPNAKISQPEDKSTYLSTDIIQFVGSESSDPESSDLTYQWSSSLDGDLGTAAAFAKNLSVGEHKITLSVTDDHGHKASSTIDVRVKFDDLPVPVLSASKSLILKNDKITLDGSKSSDVQGAVAQYYYDFGDSQNSGWGSSSQTSHQYKSAGTFSATLKVKDGTGQMSGLSAPVNITVGERPTAALSSDLTVQTIKKPLVFDASSSTDPDGTIVAYNFDFGDGTNSGWLSNKTITKTYLTPGTYEVSVKVKDDLGFESLNTAKISVTTQAPKKTKTNGLGSNLLILILVLVIVAVVIVALALAMRKRGKTATAPVQQMVQAPPAPVPPPVVQQPQPQYYDQSGQGYSQQPAYDPNQYQQPAYDPNQYQGYNQSGQQYNQYQQPPQQ